MMKTKSLGLLLISIILFGCSRVNEEVNSPRDASSSAWGPEKVMNFPGDPIPWPEDGIDVGICLVNFLPSTNYTPGYSAEDEQKILDYWFDDTAESGSIADLYDEMSFEEIRLRGEIVATVAIDKYLGDQCNMTEWRDEARAQLDALQLPNFGDLEVIVYVFPEGTSCAIYYPFKHGTAWISETYPREMAIFNHLDETLISPPSSAAHELGHLMGFSGDAGGDGRPYGDLSCIMGDDVDAEGHNLPLRQCTAFRKAMAGWIPDQFIAEVSELGPHTYYLAPSERNPSLVAGPNGLPAYQMLYFPYYEGAYGVDRSLLISYRRPEGKYDSQPSFSEYVNKISVHELVSSNGNIGPSTLLTLLEAGETFQLDDNVRITAITDGLGQEGEDYVIVEFWNCRPDPTVTISPLEYIKPTLPTGMAKFKYDLSITNNDETGTPPSNFSVSSGNNQYFEVLPIIEDLTLAPGETQVVQVRLNLLTTVPEGIHEFNIHVIDVADGHFPQDVQGALTIDASPPSKPIDLAGIADYTFASLTWSPSVDAGSGVDHYLIFRDAALVGQSLTPDFTDVGLVTGMTYNYVIQAVDRAGLVSQNSDFLALTMNLDDSPPTIPQNLTGYTGPNSVDISWSSSVDIGSGVDHYKVYRDGELVGQPVEPNFTDLGLANDETFTYTVSAVDRVGLASQISDPLTLSTNCGLAPILDLIPNSVTIPNPVPGIQSESMVLRITNSDGGDCGSDGTFAVTPVIPNEFVIIVEQTSVLLAPGEFIELEVGIYFRKSAIPSSGDYSFSIDVTGTHPGRSVVGEFTIP